MANEKKCAEGKRVKREKTTATMFVGSRIKSLRTKHRVSQAQLAELAGISSKYLGEVERGEANVSIELVSRIAMVLGLPMSAILENDHERPHEELIIEITKLIPSLSEKDAQFVYRMVKTLTE